MATFPASEFPDRYKALCHNLALARSRAYSTVLLARLNALVVAGHHHLYGARVVGRGYFLHGLLYGFPIALRANAIFVGVSAAAFLIPMLLLAIACYINGEMIFSLMGPEVVRNFESMYEPGKSVIGRERSSATDVMMFGYYIKNNVGISFQSFAGGVLLGIGSLFVMIFNGLYIGGVAGHLAQLGYGSTFFPFVAGHSALELSAIVFSGAAGLKLGYALLAPGPVPRKLALRKAGRDSAWIIFGATVMLVLAAFVEAFWSSKTAIPANTKYLVGTVLWIGVMVYCLFAGKRTHGPE